VAGNFHKDGAMVVWGRVLYERIQSTNQ
jgi:hypothetical protein